MKRQNQTKPIGLWLDHQLAHFIEPDTEPSIVATAFSNGEFHVRYKGEYGDGTLLGNHRSTNNESHKHNRTHDLREAYYQMLMDRLRQYDDIFLFGPSTAKDELKNKMEEDKDFAGRRISVASTSQPSEAEMVAAVKTHFGR